ncbi:MAG: c-type cytochrome [Pedobacter sp.]
MKTSNLFVLGLLALTFASCASPEERAVKKNNPIDTNKTDPTASMSAGTLDSNQMEGSATKKAEGGGAAPAGTPTTESAGATASPAAGASASTATPAPAAAAPAAEKTAKAEAPKTAGPGEALIKKSDCLACHNAKVKIVGPAYAAVAAKYPATPENIDKLANKIIAGGAGSWGEVPMSPHPTISKGDAKDMVRYILSLK